MLAQGGARKDHVRRHRQLCQGVPELADPRVSTRRGDETGVAVVRRHLLQRWQTGLSTYTFLGGSPSSE
jgi:hypothetical protein